MAQCNLKTPTDFLRSLNSVLHKHLCILVKALKLVILLLRLYTGTQKRKSFYQNPQQVTFISLDVRETDSTHNMAAQCKE